MSQGNKYILISVHDREILTEIFNTQKEAQEAMHKEMVEWGKVPEGIFQEEEYDDGDCGFCSYQAYANDGNNHTDYDWLIVEI